MTMANWLSIAMGLMSLGWAIYSFTLNKRQKQSEDLKADIFRVITQTKESQDKSLLETKMTITNLQTEVSKLRETVIAQTSRVEVMIQSIKEDIVKVEKTIDKQQDKIEGFGIVKVKD